MQVVEAFGHRRARRWAECSVSDVSQSAGLRIDDTVASRGRAGINSEDAHRDLTSAIDGPYGKAAGAPDGFDLGGREAGRV
jgi:hypothetical protein